MVSVKSHQDLALLKFSAESISNVVNVEDSIITIWSAGKSVTTMVRVEDMSSVGRGVRDGGLVFTFQRRSVLIGILGKWVRTRRGRGGERGRFRGVGTGSVRQVFIKRRKAGFN